ncbi:SphA family protein (plasmid) [Paraburkholderia strydomiana]
MKSFAMCSVVSIVGGLSMTPAWASEGNIFGGPVGGTDIRNANLPTKPGFYGGLVGAQTFATRAYGDNWEKNPRATVAAHVSAAAAGLLYVYPVSLWGGTLASSVQGQATYGHLTVNGRSQYFEGFGDVYSELIAYSKYFGPLWSSNPEKRVTGLPYGLTIKVAYSMLFPLGKYNTSDLQTVGHNVFYYIPNFAFTYLTEPNVFGDGVELSAHVFLDFSSRNSGTNYASGPVFDLDFAASDRMGQWQAGVAGFYARQWSDDNINKVAVPPNGKRLAALGIGPVVSCDIPKWKANLKLKVLFPMGQSNTLNITRVIVAFSKAL